MKNLKKDVFKVYQLNHKYEVIIQTDYGNYFTETTGIQAEAVFDYTVVEIETDSVNETGFYSIILDETGWYALNTDGAGYYTGMIRNMTSLRDLLLQIFLKTVDMGNHSETVGVYTLAGKLERDMLDEVFGVEAE